MLIREIWLNMCFVSTKLIEQCITNGDVSKWGLQYSPNIKVNCGFCDSVDLVM